MNRPSAPLPPPARDTETRPVCPPARGAKARRPARRFAPAPPALLFAIALAAALFFALAPAVRVHAEESAPEGDALPAYARVTQEGTWLYAAADGNTGLFILPVTYFVRVTGRADGYYSVQYLEGTAGRTAVAGWCRAEEVTPVDYTPETPFLYYDVDVTYRAGEGLPEGFLDDYTVQAAFYGLFLYGSSTYYYVELDGAFGYVPAAACSALAYPPNTEHAEAETPADGSSAPAAEGGCAAVNIVLACALCVAALGAVYFLFRPRRKKPPEEEQGYGL